MESGYIFMFDVTGLSRASRSAEILKPSQLNPHTTSYSLIFPSHLSPQPLLQPSCGHALPKSFPESPLLLIQASSFVQCLLFPRLSPQSTLTLDQLSLTELPGLSSDFTKKSFWISMTDCLVWVPPKAPEHVTATAELPGSGYYLSRL